MLKKNNEYKFQNSKLDQGTWAPVTAVLLGLLVGGLNVVFVQALAHIAKAQAVLNQDVPIHLLLAPVVFIFIWLIRRHSLYFPLKISDLVEEKQASHWSRAMLPLHFVAPLFGHASGMSLGREGAVVLYSSALSRVLNLSWSFWGPILAAIGFASILGHAWLAPLFLFDLLRPTSTIQKILSFIGALAALLVGQHFQLPHLLEIPMEFNDNIGFLSKFIFLFLIALIVGTVMRFYKRLHYALADYFAKTSLVLKIFVVLLLAALLFQPQFRIFQSLGLIHFQNLEQVSGAYESSALKLVFTLVTTSLGFLGGEFIPLVYAGVHFGKAFFTTFGYDPVLGAGLGAYLLFVAGTRMRWTGYFLIISVVGWGWWFWAYYLITWTLTFAGEDSLYRRRFWSAL